jgi:hypothetical protein
MRRYLVFTLKAAVSAALLYLAVAGIDTAILGERLQGLKYEWIAAAVGLVVVQVLLQSLRWMEVSSACDASLPLQHAVRFSLTANFFYQVLPSTLGGDAMRVLLFARSGTDLAKATYSVLLDRFVSLLSLVVVLLACLPWTLDLVQNPIGRSALLAIAAGSVSAAVAFVTIGYLPWRWLQSWQPTRHLMHISRIAREFILSAKASGLAMTTSVGIQVAAAATAWCAARAVDVPFGFLPALQLVPPIMLIASFPISVAGWGVRETSLALAFGYAGLLETDGFLVSVLIGAVTLAVGIVGGLQWLAGMDQAEKTGDAATRRPR